MVQERTRGHVLQCMKPLREVIHKLKSHSMRARKERCSWQPLLSRCTVYSYEPFYKSSRSLFWSWCTTKPRVMNDDTAWYCNTLPDFLEWPLVGYLSYIGGGGRVLEFTLPYPKAWAPAAGTSPITQHQPAVAATVEQCTHTLSILCCSITQEKLLLLLVNDAV